MVSPAILPLKRPAIQSQIRADQISAPIPVRLAEAPENELIYLQFAGISVELKFTMESFHERPRSKRRIQ
jgi:hypothetical protein